MPHLAILRDDHLGDMILTTPLVRTLGAAGWRVTVVGKSAWAGVWGNNPHAEYAALESIAPDYPQSGRSLSRWLRKLQTTHVLVPYYRPQLLWASFLSGRRNRYCQMGRVIGRLTFHHCLRSGILHTQRHMGDVWQDFAEAVGVPRQSPRPEIFLTAEERVHATERLAAKLSGTQPVVVIHPFHGGSSCHLKLSDYAAVALKLQRSSRCRVVITGVAAEREKWLSIAPDLNEDNLWVACGELSLRQLFAVVGQARLVICGSTGVLHVASALNVPSVSVMCPHPLVSPDLWRNLAEGSIDLRPDHDHCARYREKPVGDCGFYEGPFPEQVAQVAQAVLERLG